PRGLPMPGFEPLPGARKEADTVAKLLEAHDYDVVLRIGDAWKPDQVCAALVGQAWAIIHIAAHGVVDRVVTDAAGRQRRMTGVVLGDGAVLGPSIFSK